MDKEIILSILSFFGILFPSYWAYRRLFIPPQETLEQKHERIANAESIEVKTMESVNQALRARLAELEKALIEERASKINERNKRMEVNRRYERLAAYSYQLRSLLKKHAPRVEVPEMDDNGTTPSRAKL